jgi:hypothetical protein
MLEDVETGEFLEKEIDTEADLTEIDGLICYDKWQFDPDKFKFRKTVMAYSPIRHYYFSDGFDLGESRYARVGFINQYVPKRKKARKNKSKQMILFKKLKYEFLADNINTYSMDQDVEQTEYLFEIEKENSPQWNSHMKQQVIGSLLDRVLTGTSKAYDFETGRHLSVEEIYKRFGAVKDTVYFDYWYDDEWGFENEYEITENNIEQEEIKSLIFIEDWYFDPNTMRLVKEVVGIAPVRWFYTYEFETARLHRTIPFVVYFKDVETHSFEDRRLSLSVPLDDKPATLKSTIYNNHFYYHEEKVGGIDFKKDFTDMAQNGQLQLYANYSYELKSMFNTGTYEAMDIAEFKNRIGYETDTILVTDHETGMMKEVVINRTGYGIDSVCILHSNETWSFDPDNFSFDKQVFSYSPAIRFYRDDDLEFEDPRFKLIGYHLNKKQAVSDMKLFKKIKYEFGFASVEEFTYLGLPNVEINKPLFWSSYNQKTFKKVLLETAMSGKVNTYDFTTKQRLSADELKDKLVLYKDSVEDIDPETGEFIFLILTKKIEHTDINSFIFIENWYIDPQTYDIGKEVIGIAPVVYFRKDENSPDYEKKIPFVVYFNESKMF